MNRVINSALNVLPEPWLPLGSMLKKSDIPPKKKAVDLRWPEESSQGSRTELLLCKSRFGALKLANRRFEAICANRSNVMTIGGFPAN